MRAGHLISWLWPLMYVCSHRQSFVSTRAGSASIFGREAWAGARPVLVSQGANAAPDDFEKKAYVRLFLDRY